MISPLNEVLDKFTTCTLNPRCIVIVNGRHTKVEPLLNIFDINRWAVTWLDIYELSQGQFMALIPTIISMSDLTYVVVEGNDSLLMDCGYAIGLAKNSHCPVYIDFRNDLNRDDFPLCFQIADGVGCGDSDLLLFLDTFETRTEIADLATRVRSVANQIKRLRI